MALNTHIATSNPQASTSCKSCEKWRAPCPLCICPATHPSSLESEWLDEDWNVKRHKKREKGKKEQQKKEEVEKINKEDIAQKDYYPPSPIYDPNLKEDTMPAPTAKNQHLDPNYYLQTMCQIWRGCPALVNNLVAPPTKTKEENKGENTKEENRGEYTIEKEDKGESKGDKIQTENSGQEADNDEYSNYSDLDYIY